MGAYSFKKQFAPKVESGEKNHTIRADRKDGRVPKVGEILSLYYAMRTKQCRLLGRSPCTKVRNIRIIFFDDQHFIFIDEVQLDQSECEQLARADGFDSFHQMMSFWDGRLPFKGKIIHWKPLNA